MQTEIAMEIHESADDYLEIILIRRGRTGHVRSIDIATEMNYTKPSISPDADLCDARMHRSSKNGGSI